LQDAKVLVEILRRVMLARDRILEESTMALEVLKHAPAPQKSETPILFVHGAWHGAWCWNMHFLPYFAEHGYVSYALSLRSHGKSTPKHALRFTSIHQYVADVAEVAAQIKTETGKNPVIIGHSMGGYITQKYLEKYDAPAAILLASIPISGAIPFLLRTFRFLHHAPLVPLRMLITLRAYPLVRTPKLAKLMFFSEAMPLEDIEKFHPLLDDEAIRIIPESSIIARANPKKTRPTKMLVIAAENDEVFTLKEQRHLADAYGTELVVMPNIAHDVMLDIGWEQVADRMLQWLDENNL
jgi:pimeloyl-ACP methyl ester carboxylesterase